MENGAGTGWTVIELLLSNPCYLFYGVCIIKLNQDLVYSDKLSYYSNIVLWKPYSMRRILLDTIKCAAALVLRYALYSGKVESKCSSLNFNGRKNVTDMETIRLDINIKILNFIHQRLNVGHLISQFPGSTYVANLRKRRSLNNISTGQRNFSTFNINKNSLSENKAIFNQWLVGFTDGDGSFSISRQNDKWSLSFSIGQSTYNLRVLHFIKKQLGAGYIYVEKNNKLASFKIKDQAVLESIIFPIFDKYPLLTTKHFNYIKFKQAHAILSNTLLSKLEKDSLIFNIKNSLVPLSYISPAWSLVSNLVSNFETASKVMSKSWLVGFTETEGCFNLVNKSKDRLVHAFEITLKLDEIVLIAIKHILHISTNVHYKKAGHYTIVTTNSRAIENIIKYYKNTMKGIKSVEYRMWARSYVKDKGNYVALNKIRNNVRRMKTKKNYT